MFAATLVARLRQAAQKAGVLDKSSWRSEDNVAGPDLPLAKAAEMGLASMHAILRDTAKHYDQASQSLSKEPSQETNENVRMESKEAKEMQRHLRLTRAAEVRVVRNAKALLEPPDLGNFKAQPVVLDAED
jgi:pyridoxine kinase